MSTSEDQTGAPPIAPETGRRRTIWPNLVWGIPLAALVVVGYLGVRALLNRGEVVTVTFTRAAGAKPGGTKVLYQGVEAGQLTKIEPNADGRRLDFHLRLVPAARSGLNSNARFWLIGANPNFSDLSSLKAVVSGVAIGYAPGEGGEPADRFEGLDQAPLILPGDKGTRYSLRAHSLNSIHEGSIVLFHGQAIGKVIEIHFNGDKGFRLQAFINQPYDSLIRRGARFWKIAPLRLSFAGGGITANLAPVSTILAGGIDLEVDTTNADDPQSPAGTEFSLYASHSAARQGLSGPTVRYEFAFDGDAGVLDETSAVTLLGYQIGEVESTRLAYDERTGAPYGIATALLYPQQMHVNPVTAVQSTAAQSTAAQSTPNWRVATDAALTRLIHLGYRARLQQSPPVLGDQSIALMRTAGASPAQLLTEGDIPRFPSAPGSSNLDDIAAKADAFLNKLDAVPLDSIGANLERITGNLDRLMSSPELKDSLTHLHSTLTSIDKLLHDVQPQIGPLIGKLNDAAAELSGTATALHQIAESGGPNEDASLPEAIRQITEAARSIKTLTDYLDRHPEALIRGKRPEK
jgi:paraquat-inducible protein B